MQPGTGTTSTRTVLGSITFAACWVLKELVNQIPYDTHKSFKKLQPSSALLMRPGFLYALKGVLRLVPGSLLWGGVPCSLLVFISRATSKRNLDGHDIYGDPKSAPTVLSNLILSRFALLVALAISRDVWWAIEQPSTSLLPKTDYYQLFLNLAEINPIFLRMSGA